MYRDIVPVGWNPADIVRFARNKTNICASALFCVKCSHRRVQSYCFWESEFSLGSLRLRKMENLSRTKYISQHTPRPEVSWSRTHDRKYAAQSFFPAITLWNVHKIHATIVSWNLFPFLSYKFLDNMLIFYYQQYSHKFHFFSTEIPC